MFLRKKKSFTLVELVVVVFIILLICAIAIPNLLRARITSNEANAQNTLKILATALENYYGINTEYPASVNDLLTATPPYLRKNYFVGVQKGYTFTMTTLNPYDYLITTTPTGSQSGRFTFTISTGAIINKF